MPGGPVLARYQPSQRYFGIRATSAGERERGPAVRYRRGQAQAPRRHPDLPPHPGGRLLLRRQDGLRPTDRGRRRQALLPVAPAPPGASARACSWTGVAPVSWTPILLGGGGIRDAEIETAVCGGVPPADGRAGPVGAHAGGPGRGSSSRRPQAIRNRVAQAGRDAGERTDGLRTGEREEMRRLRRENRRLREEREILAKATAWFARETGSGGSTGS